MFSLIQQGNAMCFKYEAQYYGHCWDGPFIYGREAEPMMYEWFDSLGAELADAEQFCRDFFAFMEGMHERGVIKPKAEAST